MCGFYGCVDFGGSHVSASEKEKKTIHNELMKRGPDFQSFFIDRNILLYHSRLSLVDLSPASNQPVLTESNQQAFVYNGEIYNFREIVKDYNLTDVEINSDTLLIKELLDRGYAVDHFINKLDGMFAIAVCNLSTNEVTLARDRFGEKPLYYTVENEKLIFSSDAYLISKICNRSIPYTTAMQFLKYGFIPPGSCVYSGIQTVPAGTIQKFASTKTKKSLAWPAVTEDTDSQDHQDILVSFERSLLSSVSNCLNADTDVGVFLSGGVDSALIASSAAKLSKNISSFTIALDGEKNELPSVNRLCSLINIKNYVVTVSDTDFVDHFHTLFDALDCPFADTSVILFSLLSKFSKTHVKSVLTGDGADEMLWGYPKMKKGRMIQSCSHWPMNAEVFKKLTVGTKLHSFSGKSKKELIDRYYDTSKGTLTTDISGFVDPDECTDWDLKNYLPSNCLKKSDRASMAHGLEVRSPFLTKDLYTFRSGVSRANQNSIFRNKSLQRRLLKEWNSEDTTEENKKGFSFDKNKILAIINRDMGGTNIKPIVDRLGLEDLYYIKPMENLKPWEKIILWRIICLNQFLKRKNCSIG